MSDPNSATPGSAMKQSPSPGSSVPGHSSASRRPPRKSTLTQQQKNQKRQRATQDQLATLELEFNKNPTPTALVRERIAEEINMTERSVQIWFQNRYISPSSQLMNCNRDISLTNPLLLGARRLRTSLRRALRLAKILTLFPSRCVPILPCRLWNLEKGWVVTTLVALACPPSGTAVCSWEIPTLKFVSTTSSRVKVSTVFEPVG